LKKTPLIAESEAQGKIDQRPGEQKNESEGAGHPLPLAPVVCRKDLTATAKTVRIENNNS
jgi:hypothetical protein